MNGPAVRTDLVDVYVFRRVAGGSGAGSAEFLQLQRREAPLEGTWQPVMGHVEAGETAVQAAWREVREETGLDGASVVCVGGWALQCVSPYFLAGMNVVMLSPRFAVEVDAAFVPRLCGEHSAWRWVPGTGIGGAFLWPGQREACWEVLREIVGGGAGERYQRLARPVSGRP